MFSSAFDPAHAISVGLFSGRGNSDDDYGRYVDEIGETIARFRDHDAPVYLLVVDPENESPSAPWRKKIADASRDVPAQTLFIFVGGSRLTRGVVTAISWLAPRKYETQVIPSWSAACAIVQERRKVPRRVLEDLLTGARAATQADVAAVG